MFLQKGFPCGHFFNTKGLPNFWSHEIAKPVAFLVRVAPFEGLVFVFVLLVSLSTKQGSLRSGCASFLANKIWVPPNSGGKQLPHGLLFWMSGLNTIQWDPSYSDARTHPHGADPRDSDWQVGQSDGNVDNLEVATGT